MTATKPPTVPPLVATELGAAGNGVTDDTNALIAAVALASAQKRALYLPPGTYLTGSIALAGLNTVHVTGASAVGATRIQEKTGTVLPILYQAQGGPRISGVTVENITFIGQVGAVGNNNRMAVGINNATDIVVRNNVVQDFHDGAFNLYSCQRVWISGNQIYRVAQVNNYNAISLAFEPQNPDVLQAGDLWIQGNLIDTCPNGGIVVTGAPITAGTTATPRVSIQGNVVKNTGWTGIGIEGEGQMYAVVNGNQCFSCLVGATVNRGGVDQSNQPPGSRVVISNNVIDSQGLAGAQGIVANGSEISIVGNRVRSTATGIQLDVDNSMTVLESVILGNTVRLKNSDSASPTYPGIAMKHTRNGIVALNSVTREDSSSGISAGVQLIDCDESTVTGNRIRDISGHGIILDGARRVACRGNDVYDAGKSNADNYYGIRVLGSDRTGSDITISDNTIRDSGSGNHVVFDIRISSVGNAVTNVSILDNELLASGQALNAITDDFGTAVVLPRWNHVDARATDSILIAGKRQLWGTAAPGSLSWAVGDIVWNTAPAAGGNIGWVCTGAGTPGTWKTFGAIAP